VRVAEELALEIGKCSLWLGQSMKEDLWHGDVPKNIQEKKLQKLSVPAYFTRTICLQLFPSTNPLISDKMSNVKGAWDGFAIFLGCLRSVCFFGVCDALGTVADGP